MHPMKITTQWLKPSSILLVDSLAPMHSDVHIPRHRQESKILLPDSLSLSCEVSWPLHPHYPGDACMHKLIHEHTKQQCKQETSLNRKAFCNLQKVAVSFANSLMRVTTPLPSKPSNPNQSQDTRRDLAIHIINGIIRE